MNNLNVHKERRELTPPVWGMIEAVINSVSVSRTEKSQYAKKLLFCYENDLPLSLAVNGGVYVVKNRLEVEGTVIRAQIRKHPFFDYTINELNEDGCTIILMKLVGPVVLALNNEHTPGTWEELGRVSFTKEDARQAGLLDKPVYKNYPTDMFLNRATSRLYKRYCPELFMQSVYVRGEIDTDADDVIEGETLTWQELIDGHGNELVLEAVTKYQDDIYEAEKWLKSHE